MIPGVVAGFPRPSVSTASLVASNPSYWVTGSPAPIATKTGSVVSLSGRFNGTNVSGSGMQQQIGQVPEGFRPAVDLTGPLATWYSTAGVNRGPITVTVQNTGLVRLIDFAPDTSGYIVFDAARTYTAA